MNAIITAVNATRDAVRCVTLPADGKADGFGLPLSRFEGRRQIKCVSEYLEEELVSPGRL